MNFEPSEDQRALSEAFARFLDEHSSISRVRAALPGGFDGNLWRMLGEMGAIGIRAPESSGGLALGLLDATLLMEQVGRTLASGPIAEAIIAARLLASLDGPGADDLLTGLIAGEKVVTIALADVGDAPVQIVAGGAVADAVIAVDGNTVFLVRPDPSLPPVNLASQPFGQIDLVTERSVLAVGPAARALFLGGIEEWRLLIAAALHGLSGEALRLASVYATERLQFGQPIGAYQAVSHPLANLSVDNDGARFIIWKAIRQIADGAADAGALSALALWWAARTAGRIGSQGIQTFGGYGLTLEYDIHLFAVRAKSWPLIAGDPEDLLLIAADRLWGGAETALPPAGEIDLEFNPGPEAEALADELRALFEANLTPELRAKAHYSFDGFDAGFHKIVQQAGLAFPAWPKEYGGREVDAAAGLALSAVWDEYGWTTHGLSLTSQVAYMMMHFGSDQLKREALARIVSGDATCSLGFSEPHAGSDVFAAKLKAVRDGDEWVLDGQKMFTSGAEHSDYVMVLARTNIDVPKHKGLTLFVVPLKVPGVEVQAVHTFQEERTNQTFYSGVRIPDSYRLGEIDGGVKVMAKALEVEQGGGGAFVRSHFGLVARAVAHARAVQQRGRPLIESELARARLARATAHVTVSDLIMRFSIWCRANEIPPNAQSSMTKLFASEYFHADATDLLDLCAPGTLLNQTAIGHNNLEWRHSHVTRIYGGTSEIHRSMVAERRLSLPRSRSK